MGILGLGFASGAVRFHYCMIGLTKKAVTFMQAVDVCMSWSPPLLPLFEDWEGAGAELMEAVDDDEGLEVESEAEEEVSDALLSSC